MGLGAIFGILIVTILIQLMGNITHKLKIAKNFMNDNQYHEISIVTNQQTEMYLTSKGTDFNDNFSYQQSELSGACRVNLSS